MPAILLALLAVLPQLLNLTVDVTKLFDGDATEDEWSKVLSDLTSVADGIPQLKGVLTLLDPLIKIAEFSLPIITETLKTQSLVAPEVQPTDVTAAKASLRILKHLNDHVHEQVKAVQHSGEDIQKVFEIGR